MNLEFSLNTRKNGPYYVGYTPAPCTIRITDGQPANPAVTIVLANNNSNVGGQLIFYPTLNGPGSATLTLQVPSDGTTVPFYIGGKFQSPSTEDGDAAISFSVGGAAQLVVKLMVRVRKDANTLTPAERDRFLNAFVRFLQQGGYQDFLDMHNEAASGEIHGRASFLTWHRIFVLDLERHLQGIDASVTVPYWNFQDRAQNVFTTDFMGVPASTPVGQLQFTDTNPLNLWQIQGLPSLARKPRFRTSQDKANVEDAATTLGRGPGYDLFALMELNPHGNAHTSFVGPINYPPTAPRDPLFFMLHSNVDRIWAQWQNSGSQNARFDSTKPDAYNPQSKEGNFPPRVGDFLTDTMWPWNGVTTGGRPPTAPGGPMITSSFTNFPGAQPKVADSIDYQGRLTTQTLYCDYDTIPYIGNAGVVAPSGFLAAESQRITTFHNAADPVALTQALSNLSMLSDNDSIDKSVEILKDDQNDAGMRVLALSRLTAAVSTKPDLIQYVLQLLADKNTPPDLRVEALTTIETIGFGSPIVAGLNNEIIATFRGLIQDENQDIRWNAIGYLAKAKDEFVQRALLAGLTDSTKALVPEDLAIHLLGYDIHADIYPILRNIVEKSSNNESRTEALHLLGSDPDSKDLLLGIFNNTRERPSVRKSSLLALKQLFPDDFIRMARKTVEDASEPESLRLLSSKAIEHSEKQ